VKMLTRIIWEWTVHFLVEPLVIILDPLEKIRLVEIMCFSPSCFTVVHTTIVFSHFKWHENNMGY